MSDDAKIISRRQILVLSSLFGARLLTGCGPGTSSAKEACPDGQDPPAPASGLPLARTLGLSVEVDGASLLVSDERASKVYRLHPATAVVWNYCDGATDVPTLGGKVTELLGITLSQDAVWVLLDVLADAKLLVARVTPPGGAITLSLDDQNALEATQDELVVLQQGIALTGTCVQETAARDQLRAEEEQGKSKLKGYEQAESGSSQEVSGKEAQSKSQDMDQEATSKELSSKESSAKTQASTQEADSKELTTKESSSKSDSTMQESNAKELSTKESSSKSDSTMQESNAKELSTKESSSKSDSTMQESNAKELSTKESTAKTDSTMQESTNKEITTKESDAKSKINQEQTAKEQTAKEQTAKEQTAKEQTAKEQTAKQQAEQMAKEPSQKEGTTKEQVNKEQMNKEQMNKEQMNKEQMNKEQMNKELMKGP